ncbi:MAG: apolipoprotein N-acyltransferase [Verrucomicrobiota bacterium]|nr:apolipoprotein N-acyltransferase [Verrucomicrobiota bacterium]
MNPEPTRIGRKPFYRSFRLWLAVAGGLCLAFSFQKFSIAALAWLGPGLILLSGIGTRGWDSFRLGYAAGLAQFMVSLYWLLLIPFPAGAISGWLALSAYLAIYPGIWVWLSSLIFPQFIDPELSTQERLSKFCGVSWSRRALWLVGVAMTWVSLEMVMARLLTGFPWNLAGVSQLPVLPLVQISSFTGVYGVSFVVVYGSCALMTAGIFLGRFPAQRFLWMREVILALLLVAIVAAYGMRKILNFRKPEQTVKLALVQPSIPQVMIWNEKESTNRFNQLIDLSEKALAEKPKVLIWPEAAVPNMLRHNPETAGELVRLVRDHGVWAIVGTDDAEPKSQDERENRNWIFYNSSFAISPRGELAGDYKKRQLVMFGEYVPLVQYFPFMKFLTPIGDVGFTPGTKAVPFHLSDLDIRTSVMICFEDIFPHLAREYVTEDTDFLLNLTNNGWFGESAAQWQHAMNGAFRAIELGVPFVRCANNGLTCWIDSLGVIHNERFADGSPDIYKAGYKIVEVPVLAEGKHELTFYSKNGDLFGYGCVAFSALFLLTALFRKRA